QLTYDMPWGTTVGLESNVSSGTPLSTTINLVGYSPTFINGRGDLGRTPVFSDFDLALTHEFKMPFNERNKVKLDANIINLFEHKTVLQTAQTPWRDTCQVPASVAPAIAPPGVLTPRDAYLLNGYDPVDLHNLMLKNGSTHRDNALFGK